MLSALLPTTWHDIHSRELTPYARYHIHNPKRTHATMGHHRNHTHMQKCIFPSRLILKWAVPKDFLNNTREQGQSSNSALHLSNHSAKARSFHIFHSKYHKSQTDPTHHLPF